ncbi:M23 family metallopeptidase [Dyella silvatica]|uniref:M23 family metallopeptidase n=1 Tax=Dyella silvatica TaxID=2992128 RepID=UPI00224E0769|nr:M23 family metallopeptidase [Dyella silvatica]
MPLWIRNRAALLVMSIALSFVTMDSYAVTPIGEPADGCIAAGLGKGTNPPPTEAAPAFPPPQLQILTPYAPTYFPSGGRQYLIYELHIQNLSEASMDIMGIDVINAGSASNERVISIQPLELRSVLQPVGATPRPKDTSYGYRLDEGRAVVAFLCMAFDGNTPLPTRISHRVFLSNAIANGPDIHVAPGPLPVLSAPVAGMDWTAADGPSNESHHRLGLFVANGAAQISRRYAIDWKQLKNGSSFSGDPRDVHAYYAYGRDVLAVADAVVVGVKDGLPDNIPRTPAGFNTAVPITMETVAGNSVILELGHGQFAYYAHLKAGSLRVKKGDHVKRGQWLANIGNSGDAREPHLHFQLETGADILDSEGMPYVIDHYKVKTERGWDERSGELPVRGMLVDFGQPQAK